MLLYAMLYGTMPFDGHDFRSLRQQITNGLIQQPSSLSGLYHKHTETDTQTDRDRQTHRHTQTCALMAGLLQVRENWK